MSLTDVMCKKVLLQEKQYRLSDINGLSLRIDLNGNKYWSKLDSTIQRSIFHLLELMALQSTKNGLCEIKINPVDLYKVEDNLSQLKLKLIKVEESAVRSLDHSEVKMIKNSPINHKAKQVKEKIRVKVSATKPKKAPIRSKGKVDL